jgi:predicted secreted protein
MPFKIRTTSPFSTAAILVGLVLSAPLTGCQTEENHKAHHHHHGQVNTTPPTTKATPAQKAPEQIEDTSQVAPKTPAPEETPPAQAATSDPEDSTSAIEQTKTITIDAATSEGEKNRVEVKMPAGGVLTIQLPFQAGTGYNWALSSISSDLKMMSQTTRSLSDDGRSGGPMLAVYVLECLSANSVQTARFELSRPWETDTSPVRELVLLVNSTSTESGM